MPRLSTIRYVPKLSIFWDGKTLRYFSHKKPALPLGITRAWATVAGLSDLLDIFLAIELL
jgi:hypothetical protein